MLKLNMNFMGIDIVEAIAEVGIIIIKTNHNNLEFQLCYKSSAGNDIFLTETYEMDFSDDSQPLLDKIYSFLKEKDKFSEAVYEKA